MSAVEATIGEAQLEVERAALYGIVQEAEATWPVLKEHWGPGLFAVEHHQVAAAAAVERLQRGEPVDTLVVASDLMAAGRAPAANTLVSVVRNLGNVVNAAEYVRRLAELRDARGDVREAARDIRDILRTSVRRFTPEQLADAPPPLKYILHPYIPERKVVTLAGPGGSNKTTLLTYLAVCRALGLEFFGRSVPSRGKTVILTTEDGVNDYWRRLAALREDLGETFDAHAIAESIIVIDLSGEQVRLIEQDRGMFSISPFVDHFAKLLRKEAPDADLVICETVSRLTGGIETNDSLSVLVNAAEHVCKLAEVTMLLVAHVSQEAGREGFADQYAARGGSAFGDNARSSLVLTPLNDKNKKLYLPDADISPSEMKDLLLLRHPKSIGPRADDLLLQRVSTRHGPVLHRAVVRSKEENRSALRAKLVEIIRKLAATGIEVTRNLVETTYAGDLGCGQKAVRKLIFEAVEAGELAERARHRGGGKVLVILGGEADPTPPTHRPENRELPLGTPAAGPADLSGKVAGRQSGRGSATALPDCRTAQPNPAESLTTECPADLSGNPLAGQQTNSEPENGG